MQRTAHLLLIPIVVGVFFVGCVPTLPKLPSFIDILPTPPATRSPAIVQYSNLEDAKNRSKLGPTILFFAASWDPTCQFAKRDLSLHLNELPRHTTIVVVDFDTETELKQTYGVTGAHTWVQINSNGDKLSYWRGDTIKEILTHIKQ